GEDPSNFGLATPSNRAELISGGDALLEVRVPKSVALNTVRLSLNGDDVTGAFTANAKARTLRGLVSGLVEGRNDFVAGESRGGREARLVITNHPVGGPVLFDPAQPWSALAPQAQWNGKVVYTFGASTGQPRLQFRSEQNWADDAALSRGFMVVDNSLTDSLFNSNRVLNAETLMMMKEHIVDTYGEIKYTVATGCSGGSIQQNTAASIFPGLLDGIQPSCDYPDSSTTGLEVGDCVLLVNLYDGPEWKALMDGKPLAEIQAKKAAINGHLSHLGCQSWNNAFGFNNKPGNYARTVILGPPTNDMATGKLTLLNESRNNCLLPAELVYDPVTNPRGTRCGDPDLSAAVWGTTAGIAPGSTRAL